MKSTDNFKKVIESFLQEMAKKDEVFAKRLDRDDKNIEDCITYILNTVKKSGCSGFSDEEIFGMAVHYYDEDEIDIGGKVKAKVVVNHTIQNKSKVKSEKPIAAKKPESKVREVQQSLF